MRGVANVMEEPWQRPRLIVSEFIWIGIHMVHGFIATTLQIGTRCFSANSGFKFPMNEGTTYSCELLLGAKFI